jgi:beta-xylosidase
LFWGSYWTGIKATELDPGTGKPASTQPAGTPVAGRRKGASQAIEAAYVIKRKDHYYLFVSWDFCCAGEQSTYKVMVGRATCPLGPYVDDHGVPLNDGGGRLVLMGDLRWRGPGHNSVLQTAEGDWLVYHAIDAEKSGGGRELQIRPIRWVDDWPTVGPPLTADGVTPAETTAKTSPLVGRWEHVVNSKDRYDIFLEANGLVTGVAGEAAWEQTGNRVQMRWRDPQAPGGFWVDQVTFDPDHQQYSGENQRGVTIRGRRR